jgi:hypothetical protein
MASRDDLTQPSRFPALTPKFSITFDFLYTHLPLSQSSYIFTSGFRYQLKSVLKGKTFKK